MPRHAANLISEGKTVAGLFIVPRTLSLRHAIEELDVLVNCSENQEWVNVIFYLQP